MRLNCPRSWTAVLLALLCLSTSHFAKADSYTFFTIGPTDSGSIVAMDDYGDWTVRLVGSYTDTRCGVNASSCYATYSAYSQQTTYTTFQPTLISDPSPIAGSGCTVPASQIDDAQAYCNNGHEALGNIAGVWAVTNGVASLVYHGAPAYTVMITPSGNLYFADGLHENLVIGLDTTTLPAAVPLQITPEPGSLCLLATGALGVVSMARRRFTA